MFNSSNLTTAEDPLNGLVTALAAKWSVIPVFLAFTSLAGILGNAGLALLFFTSTLLRQTFNAFDIYIINLLLVNVLSILMVYPMDLLTSLYSKWFMGNSACTVFLYGEYMLLSIVVNSHALMAAARVWAIAHPISYHNLHSPRVALLSCFLVWLYVHLFMAPGVILDALYYRAPVELYGCFLNAFAQPKWSLANLFVIYYGSCLMIVLSLAVVVVLTIVRRVRGKVNPDHSTSRTRRTLNSSGESGERPKQSPAWRKVYVLIFLTISAMVCWLPSCLFYLAIELKFERWIPDFEVAKVLYSCQPMLDPVFFALSFSRIRDALRRLLLRAQR